MNVLSFFPLQQCARMATKCCTVISAVAVAVVGFGAPFVSAQNTVDVSVILRDFIVSSILLADFSFFLRIFFSTFFPVNFSPQAFYLAMVW